MTDVRTICPATLVSVMHRRRVSVPETTEELVNFAVAQVRAHMTRRERIAYAARLVYVALTGRRP